MNSKIAEAIKLSTEPVAICWSETVPEDAIMFNKKTWGCSMWLMSAAAKGMISAVTRENFGCFGGAVGAGFGENIKNFPGGVSCFCHFLSSGNKGNPQGEAVAEQMKGKADEKFVEQFMEGERYIKDPEGVEEYLGNLPLIDIEYDYVLYKPLSQVNVEKEEPISVLYFCDPDQFSAIGVLANYTYPGNENVYFPFAAGCQAIGICSYAEGLKDNPRAVAGPMDLSARLYLRNQFDEHIMTMSLPWDMFTEMEKNVEESFLSRPVWKELVKDKDKKEDDGHSHGDGGCGSGCSCGH